MKIDAWLIQWPMQSTAYAGSRIQNRALIKMDKYNNFALTQRTIMYMTIDILY